MGPDLLPCLALIDSVSKAHGVGAVSVVRRLHSESVSQLSQNLFISFKFQLKAALALNQGGK